MTVDVISRQLQSEHIVIPDKKFSFGKNMVMNILKNEKYCGDCILQKTVTVDCISKTRKKNEGEAPMYIVENSHPAIISREMFNRAQEELSKRKARSPQSQKTAITASGKYSKYALTDVLICAECGSRGDIFHKKKWRPFSFSNSGNFKEESASCIVCKSEPLSSN